MAYNTFKIIHDPFDWLCSLDLSLPSTPIFATVLLLVPVLVVARRYRRAVAMISDFPGLRLIVSPMSSLGLVLPRLPMPLYTYPGFTFPSTLKHEGLFKHFKCDTVSLCGALDGRAILYTCDVPFLTRMASHAGSTIFPKPVEEYTVLSYFGDNVVIAEGPNWRRQRKVTAPAFCSKLFERLWTDMADITREMIQEEEWGQHTDDLVMPAAPQFTPSGEYVPAKGEIYFPNVVDLTLRMALAAIARTGFGIDFEWRTGHSFTATCKSFGDSPLRLFGKQMIAVLHTVLTFPIPRSFRARLQRRLLEGNWRAFDYLRILSLALLRGPLPAPVEEMRLQEALHIVAKESTLKLAMESLPSWFSKLPFKRLRRMNLAFGTLQDGLRKMIAQRRHELAAEADCDSATSSPDTEDSGSSKFSQSSIGSSISSSSHLPRDFDLLSNLVRSVLQCEKAGGNSLTEDEIIGNAYIYLLAGHETTAHSLAWTLALLAAYPDEQEKAYKEIMEGDPSEDTIIRDYPKFRFVLACYYETLRLFSPVQQIPKIAAEDTQIVIERSNKVDHSRQEAVAEFAAGLAAMSADRDRLSPYSIPEAAFKRGHSSRASSISGSVSRPPSVNGHRKRPSLAPLTLGGSRLDPSFGIPSLPSTPFWTPPKEYLGLPGDGSPLPSPASVRSELFGPPPFVQVSKGGQAIEVDPPVVRQEDVSIVVKKGTIIFISPPAVHHNPKYWENPHQFNPERFLKPYNKAAFIPFGVGTRACLGRKFSEVESVCMLVHLLRNYSVHLAVQPGETVEQVREKFSRASVRITLTPEKVPLIFRRRTHA